ncbi:MAG: helix-turn-helix domain-containing protein [Pseudomonadota bacterium]|jgi:putative transcriptional regulator|nr:transcriptional regulator [Alphaproteobacteria bacterium]
MGDVYKGVKAGLEDAIAGRYTVYKEEPVDLKVLRQQLSMTQEQFAQRFGIPLASLRNWEQNHRLPSGPIRSYLRVIEKNPKAVLKALMSA